MTYEEAKVLFQRARNKERGYVLPGRLGQTRLVQTEHGYGVKYVATVVVEIREDGTYRLDTGGWRTVTTKERINYYAPVRMYQRNHVWYLKDGVPFSDGIIVDKRGRVKSAPNAKQVKQIARIHKQIAKYVDGYAKAIEAKTLAEPSGGDCWFCVGLVTDARTGAKSADNGHLMNHVHENYYVPSLLVNALRAKGYRPEYVNPWNGITRDTKTFKRALRDYLKAALCK
jgi:hypothetical protein